MTYLELLQAARNTDLINRTQVACIVAAEAIGNELNTGPNYANRMKWAKAVFNAPAGEALPMLHAVLAKNRGMTLAAIIAVSDATLQTAVDTEVNTLAGVT